MKRLSRNSEQSQFLIGRVEPADFYIEVERISAGKVSQFLIGKVELDTYIYNELTRIASQFLIGKV